MSLNPLRFTEHVLGDFLRYQLTAYPFADERLHARLREHLSVGEVRRSPLVRGPYVSLSRAFATGASVEALVAEGLLHPHVPRLVPFHDLYGHQEAAIRAIAAGRTTLISTGTGSGKTECFLYPAIGRCLELRDAGAPPGIVAVFLYPMNALAEDQLLRIRGLLAGTGIPFGMYVGRTPQKRADVAGERLSAGASRADYEAAVARVRAEGRSDPVYPVEERVSREEMRAAGGQPRILLTNVKQLELLLTRQADVELFEGARLDFLVFDEAHTSSGAEGAEAACLIRRLRAFCGRSPAETVCVGTSATLADPVHGLEPARDFASRFFGVARDQVEVVTERHRDDDWAAARSWPRALSGDPSAWLGRALDAVADDQGAGERVAGLWHALTGGELPAADWQGALYDALSRDELCFRMAQALARPLALESLAERLSREAGRPVPEEEALVWLVLGTASRRDGRPLLRPVVHTFVRGMGGAVVTFEPGSAEPRLWIVAADGSGAPAERFRLSVMTCTTCGQHYFEHFVADLVVKARGLEGGEAVGDSRIWRALDRARGGARVVLLDQLITADEEDGDDDPPHTVPAHLCAVCGTLHPEARPRCEGCGREGPLVPLLAVHSEKRPGQLTTCLSCRAPGRQRPGLWREPARPVRAVAVSDVHVLAQNMIHRAERRRLLVFADNRQDAAFQAGWMRDHARRFRLRSLLMERTEQGALSVGDLVAHLDRVLDDDDELSRALVPEVWNFDRKEAGGTEHARQRRYFLRILTLREIATGVKQRLGLEPWGRIRVEYHGLTPDLPFVQEWARRLSTTPERLADGIAAILDTHRRSLMLWDADAPVFSRFWSEGDREVQRGYLPLLRGVPKGVKLERGPHDEAGRVSQWLSARGDTTVRQAARAFGAEKDAAEEFLRGLWKLLAEELRLLAPVTLKGQRGGALPGCAGTRQVDSSRLLVGPHRGRWRCQKCRRSQVRPTPGDRCLAWRCDGQLERVPDDPDNYDLLALDQRFAMLRPAEHSAQVPHDERERLERQFKGEREQVNTLVCTPTLELGVDIGGLDTVLMRNVPPLPSNYWQRVGRAGRRHRLAVNVTYARDTSHDRAYFAEPLKLLEGRVDPPRFNLRNDVMVGKHVRASVVARLHQLARPGGGLEDAGREEIAAALKHAFPTFVRDYLFDAAGHVRGEAFDPAPLRDVVARHEADLLSTVERIFLTTWPAGDAQVVTSERLRGAVQETADELSRAIARIRKRLEWSLRVMDELTREGKKKGALDSDQEALRNRCERLVKRLKGTETKKGRETEGYDDRLTYAALAIEGFLPGYGLETGFIRATALVPRPLGGGGDFMLTRPPEAALREYVPGNLIYANGGEFAARFYQFEATEPLLFDVDRARGAVREAGAARDGAIQALAGGRLKAVPICDCELIFRSHISDEEDHRFQLPVSMLGEELDRHEGGTAYRWGGRDMLLRRGVRLRLVNVGAASLVREGRLGYPMSFAGSQCMSPYASQRQLDEFSNSMQERYGRPVEWNGFYTDMAADALTLQNLDNPAEAYSVLEAIRAGMSLVLEMDREDLEILVIARMGVDQVDGFLYDPMPGGSGLLVHACERWHEVIEAALDIVEHCPSGCERSCVDCLQTFRNAFFHEHLDRQIAARRLREWGTTLSVTHEIPPRMPAEAPRGGKVPSNVAEERLRQMMKRAGLPEFEWQKRILLGPPHGSTTPDAFSPMDDIPGLCVYLDGLSGHLHGNPGTAARDRELRTALRARGYEVVEIAASDLDDRDAMAIHLARIARILVGKDAARAVRDDPAWFEA